MTHHLRFNNGKYGTQRKTALVMDFLVYQATVDTDGYVVVVFAETQNDRTTLREETLAAFNAEYTHNDTLSED